MVYDGLLFFSTALESFFLCSDQDRSHLMVDISIWFKWKKENNVNHLCSLALSDQHSQMHTPYIQKEEVKSCIEGRRSMHHAVKLFQSDIATVKPELWSVESPPLGEYFLDNKLSQ